MSSNYQQNAKSIMGPLRRLSENVKCDGVNEVVINLTNNIDNLSPDDLSNAFYLVTNISIKINKYFSQSGNR